jgi:hypothetical protein
MHRSLPIRLLLIFALLLSQLGGLTHGIEHTLAAQSEDHSLPHDRLCDLCASYAQLGCALGSSSPGFAVTENFEAHYSDDSSTHLSATFVAFAARAPPRSV